MRRRTVIVPALLCLLVPGIGGCSEREPSRARAKASPVNEDTYRQQRDTMVAEQIAGRDVTDARVLAAMRAVPRHEFVPEQYRGMAYDDHPLPIGHNQTISQPYIVARMTELAEVGKDDRVLEIGTGSGYQAAVLSRLAAKVYTIEILEPLADSARDQLKRLGCSNVTVRCGDGFAGWAEHAPFDAIIVTCAAPRVPQALIDQLKVGGRLVIPVGDEYQELMLLTRTADGVKEQRVAPVRFVPMVGEIQRKK